MDAKRAKAILTRMGVGGKLEVVLYANVTGDGGGVEVPRHTYAHGFNGGRRGESLLGRLAKIDEDSFEIADGWCDGRPTNALNRQTTVYYRDVHSIYLLRRGYAPRQLRP